MIGLKVRQKSAFFTFRAVLMALSMILILLSCEELEQKYIHQDKLFKIALLEDSRAGDTLLTSREVLSDPNPDIRIHAAVAIGRIGGEFYTRALKANLRDTIGAVAEAKYFAAGLLGDSSLFDSLYFLARTEALAREVAVEALGRVANAEQAPRLEEFLTDPDSLVVYQAMLAIWRANGWSLAPKMAEIGSQSANRKVKYGALYALSRGGRSEGRRLFLDLISDSDPEFRMLAYTGLARSADTASIKHIAGGLNDADNRVVASALYSLRSFGNLGSAFIGEKLPGLKDEKLVSLAVEIIGQYPEFSGASRIILDILENDNRDNVLAAAAGSLLRVEGVKALVAIDQKLTEPTMYQKLAIAEGVREIDPQAAMARLTPLFNDPAPLVRATALESLCRIDSNSAAQYIKTALADEDFVVIATAVEQAGNRKLNSLIPDIAAIYLERRHVIDQDLKRTIIDAWSKFDTAAVHDSLIMAVLDEGCNDEWFVIRREAAQVLWDKYGIDKRGQVQRARSNIEKRNFRKLFFKYENNPLAILETSRGDIIIELLYDTATKTVNNFIGLAQQGFYDNKVFHRVVPNFVVQDGCPRGDGWGGPGYTLRCEYSRLSYITGMVGMAHSGKDTGGSQYFITLSPQPHLDGRYTVFGRVIEGMEAVQQLVRGDSIISVTIQYNREET